MQFLSTLSLLAATALAAPSQERATGPSVQITQGTVVGSSLAGIDSFKGVPFAQPPVGDLRLRAPKPITKSLGTINAVGVPKACPQLFFTIDTSNLPTAAAQLLLDTPIAQTVQDEGEDCLTLNIQRPANVDKNAKLPVLFWIYGGGFEIGSTQMYDGSGIVQKSVNMGKAVIYVSVNYRLGGFGFLAGNALAKEGNTNLGLRDQRLGLQWVADNIAAFGGDPSKVTIWGESAGSISVFDQTIINGGDNTYKGKPLFRAAIMDSGSVVPANTVTTGAANAIFNTVSKAAGCSGNDEATLECLRKTDYTTFLNAANSAPSITSYRSVDLSYLPRADPGNKFFAEYPEVAVAKGKFAKVPIIIGDQEDEGTLFALPAINSTQTNDQITDYLTSYFPDTPNARQNVVELLTYYPDQPELGQPAGSPFRTGPLNSITPQFKRLSAVLGDITFTLTRRTYLSTVASQVPSWTYLSTYFYGTPVLGTFHATDILVDYFGQIATPAQASLGYYISFVNELDPNALGFSGAQIQWPKWDNTKRAMINIGLTDVTLMADNFRESAYQYLKTHASSLRV